MHGTLISQWPRRVTANPRSTSRPTSRRLTRAWRRTHWPGSTAPRRSSTLKTPDSPGPSLSLAPNHVSTLTFSHKTLSSVNFTNILHEPFLYEIILRSFSLLTVWLCIFLVKEYQHKSCSNNVDKIDYRAVVTKWEPLVTFDYL